MSRETQDKVPASEPAQGRAQLIQMLIDFAPLLAFFASYATLGLYWATLIVMVATVVSVIASRMVLGHISAMLIFNASVLLGLGGLTLALDDPRFIKMKPTIVSTLIAGLLIGGLIIGKPVLKLVLGSTLRLTDVGWHKLTLRWAVFFLLIAVLNELIWRSCPTATETSVRVLGLWSTTCSEATWVKFKAFGILLMTLVFSVSQVRLMQRHADDGAPH